MSVADVVVVGAGLNGLVAGAWLARRKLSVVVLDQRPMPGGAAVTSEFAPGFRAPILSHAFGPIDHHVARAVRLDRAVQFITPDPALTALGRDGRAIVFHRDPVLTAGSINAISSSDAIKWNEFLRTSHRVAGLIAGLNQHAPPSIDEIDAREYLRLLLVGRRARKLGRRDLARVARWVPMAVADFVAEWFETDLLRAAVASRAVFGNPVGPWSAGTTATFMQRLAEDPLPVGSGVTARGGPGAVADALAKIATKAGATIRANARVANIMARDGRVTGVVLDGGDEIPARTVVSAVDPRQTFLKLTDPADLPPTFVDRIRNYRARGVTAKINLALDRAPVFTSFEGDAVPSRGRFVVAPDIDYLERAFDATKYGKISDDPWLELSVPSITDPSLAPDGRHVMSIYFHFAPRDLRGASWSDHRERLYQSAMRVLEPHVRELPSIVSTCQVLTPEDLEHTWGLSGGHIFHGEPSLDQSWIARPLLGWAQYRTPIEGLYLGGAGTHPGGGLTGLSGLLAAKTVARDLKSRRKGL
ncbi:MAG TPA: NAD(P)/FAD-dependent oxidoreductase [Vicinamibacterales bacterium]|nr:NAD(P)/FAD-dependent oxidoreductase [Vicinamibacterales bacterium]